MPAKKDRVIEAGNKYRILENLELVPLPIRADFEAASEAAAGAGTISAGPCPLPRSESGSFRPQRPRPG